ncbi:MAG: TniQ family protein, partial [Kocuria sp.]|nr:TniQ family protein [Kocuria sp.]
MVTRTLPIRVNPARGEALDSWLEKIAHRTRSSFSDVLDAVGLEPGNGGSGLQGVKILRDTEVKSLATATGARPDTIRAMTLARYNSIAVDIDEDSRTINRRTLWGRGTGSRFCPECLTANEGRWSLSWRLGWVYACLTHECL